jgi:hypothetical protein
LCSPCLKNSSWTITLSMPHPVSASPHSSWRSCKGGVLPVASPKMYCKHKLTSCLLMRLDSQEMTLWTFIIPLSWVDDNHHTTVAKRHQHRFSISVWVGILDDQLLGPLVLPNRLSGAV